MFPFFFLEYMFLGDCHSPSISLCRCVLVVCFSFAVKLETPFVFSCISYCFHFSFFFMWIIHLLLFFFYFLKFVFIFLVLFLYFLWYSRERVHERKISLFSFLTWLKCCLNNYSLSGKSLPFRIFARINTVFLLAVAKSKAFWFLDLTM